MMKKTDIENLLPLSLEAQNQAMYRYMTILDQKQINGATEENYNGAG